MIDIIKFVRDIVFTRRGEREEREWTQKGKNRSKIKHGVLMFFKDTRT